jgi:hypothetical protein
MLRAFHLAAKNAVKSHPDWNGCTADRQCEVWTDGDEDRARALAHRKFWQEATPVKPDSSSPWTDPELVECHEIGVPAKAAAPADEVVFAWDQRMLASPEAPRTQGGQAAGAARDPTKKLDQH